MEPSASFSSSSQPPRQRWRRSEDENTVVPSTSATPAPSMYSRKTHHRTDTDPNLVVPMDDRRDSVMSSRSSHHSNKGSDGDETVSLGAVDMEVVQNQQRGVTRIEALHRVFGEHKYAITTLYIAVAGVVCAFSLDSNTTSNYLPNATSDYQNHSLLATILVAENIMTAVCKPFIAKICDISSRQHAYVFVTVFYVIGYIMIAASNNVATLCIGRVISTVGEAGLDLVTDIIVADLSPLQWRGFMSAMTSSPNLVLAWVGAKIAGSILAQNKWRWGYGMFTIIIPVMVSPAIVVLFLADREAHRRRDVVSFAASPYERRLLEEQGTTTDKLSYTQLVKRFLVEIDSVGLVILGFGLSLFLLPWTLAPNADGGWSNPSMIAMVVVGAALLGVFGIWEYYLAPVPLMPKRIFLNRTFQLAVIIDIFYFMSGTLRSTYYSSYVYVITEWSFTNWSYFNNVSTFILSLFGIIAGLLLRFTHRYKFLQLSGLAIRMLGMGLTLYARGDNATDAALICTNIIIYIGGSFSVVGSRVASQASVPHQDLASVVALLALWTKIGGAVGAAIAGLVWTSTMRDNMRAEGIPEVSVERLFESIKAARNSPYRAAVLRAYDKTVYLLFVLALVLTALPLIAGFFMPNYYLGNTQNAVDGTDVGGRKTLASRPGNDNTKAPEDQIAHDDEITKPSSETESDNSGPTAQPSQGGAPASLPA